MAKPTTEVDLSGFGLERIQHIGRGQFASAQLVKDTSTGNSYVAKCISLAALNDHDQDLAHQEVFLLQTLSHPYIVAYRDSFLIEGANTLVIVMEYCDAGDLRKAIKDKSKTGDHFAEEQVMSWFVQLCMALQYIHSEKVLHRDLKTSNIFLTGGGSQIKLGDFGISRVLEGTTEAAVTIVGTPYYMSPEVCRSEPYNWKSDIWVALVCADTFRAGAFDQLKQNATKVRIPFYGSYTETDPVSIAVEGVETFKAERYELIVVDTSGRHKQEAALFDEMQQVQDAIQPDDVVFVMDSHIGQACYDQAKAFADCVRVGSVIVTKLDGHAKGGGALSAVAATNSPVLFVGTGEHFDDFEPFNAHSFVSRLCGLGDISGLVSTINEAMPLDKQPELIGRLSKGVFTLRDMYEQLQYVTKLGSLQTVMSMIPGINTDMFPQGYEKHGVQRIKRFMTIMDSMTDAELDCKKGACLDKELSRVIRVARGSGTHPMAVAELLNEHKRFERMVGKMGKAGLMKETGDMANLNRNPKQVLQKLQSCVDPWMLQQMGGAQNMLNLMKQMDGMDEFGGGASVGKKGKKGKR